MDRPGPMPLGVAVAEVGKLPPFKVVITAGGTKPGKSGPLPLPGTIRPMVAVVSRLACAGEGGEGGLGGRKPPFRSPDVKCSDQSETNWVGVVSARKSVTVSV